MLSAPPLFGYRKYWAARFGPAPFLPMSRPEMDELGWDACDIIIVTGDAYVDHPSFGMAIVGRMLEAQGFRVGLIAQPDWRDTTAFEALGAPRLFFGITAGNMDSMVNRYTSDRRLRSDDAYTPHGVAGKRPDRSVIVYSQRVREAFPETPVIVGGIEASLRRIAHFDYWSEKVRRSVLLDAKADLLVFGNGERQIVEIAHRLAGGAEISALTDIRGTSFAQRGPREGWIEIDSTHLDVPGKINPPVDPYAMAENDSPNNSAAPAEPGVTQIPLRLVRAAREVRRADRARSAIRLPAFEQVRDDPVLYAHASRVLHLEANPGNARALVQAHGDIDVWLNPPPIPLTTEELDGVYERPYQRRPHPAYEDAKIPAYEMIRFSISIQRGCFGGCTFCSITEHEGRIIQSRSEDSVIKEVEAIRDSVKGFTGTISDLGGPTANMYRIGCKSPEIEAACRKPSCVYPGICSNLNTDHSALIRMYRRARALKGVKKILISSGLRYDLAVQSPEYVKELVTHHVGGYLKIAPEHTEQGPLTKMMKPGIGSYDRFKQLFEKFSAEAGKKQYLIPYFIAAHPGTSDEDMMNLALWLKKNGFRADQVQNFYPSPMATATAMYHSKRNPLRRITPDSETVDIVRGDKRRRLHKAFLRYHDANNWPLLREALKTMGRSDLIGNGKHHLIPTFQPLTDGNYTSARKKNSTAASGKAAPPVKGRLLTQHTGLPPRETGGASEKSRAGAAKRR